MHNLFSKISSMPNLTANSKSAYEESFLCKFNFVIKITVALSDVI